MGCFVYFSDIFFRTGNVLGLCGIDKDLQHGNGLSSDKKMEELNLRDLSVTHSAPVIDYSSSSCFFNCEVLVPVGLLT